MGDTKQGFRSVALILVGVIVLFVGATVLGGAFYVTAAHRSVGSPPPDLQAQQVSFHGDSGNKISGWLVPGEPGKGAVLLLHGIRSNRLSMIPRARFLKTLGYTVLLVDLQAHGESGGDFITFGLREAHGAKAAVEFLKQSAPEEKIGAIGVSLGGAALIFAAQNIALDALVLESVYSTIETACENRLRARIGLFAPYMNPFLLWQLPYRLGITVSDLRPIEHLSGIRTPVLMISGTEDLHTTLEESKMMYDKVTAPKERWWVPGAAHVDLYAFAGPAYEKQVSAFLSRYLKREEWRSGDENVSAS